jgi:hypothetical protein
MTVIVQKIMEKVPRIWLGSSAGAPCGKMLAKTYSGLVPTSPYTMPRVPKASKASGHPRLPRSCAARRVPCVVGAPTAAGGNGGWRLQAASGG